MPFRTLSAEDMIAGGTRIIQAGLGGGKFAVAYGKPALEKSANLTVQVCIHLLHMKKALMIAIKIR